MRLALGPHLPGIAGLFLLMLAGTAQADERLSGGAALRPFFASLRALELHRGRQPVRILQIGDSHTANDSFSGRMRELFQARFGAAGRGWLPAGIPFQYFRPAQVSVSEEGWRHPQLGEATAGDLFGLDAVLARAEAADAHMTLASTEPGGIERVAIEFVARPGGAPLALRVDAGPVWQIPTAAPHVAVGRYQKILSKGAREIQLKATEPNQEVLAWTGERRAPGIIYENHGKIGASADLLSRVNPVAVDFELKERRPTLLIVAFGTNEGFNDALDLRHYAKRFQAGVLAVQRAAPGAAILIVGAPDGNRRPRECRKETASACGSSADIAENCGWREPPKLGAVRDIQRRLAARHGWAFWDWSAAMGGSCSMHRWLSRDPPRAMPDHVHLNKLGYAETAERLFDDLVAEYEKRHPRASGAGPHPVNRR